MAEKKDSEKGRGERTFIVRYRLPGEEGRNVRKVKVSARSQSDAKKAALATIPNAKIVGGPQELDEGLGDFAARVGKFVSRCAGRGCHAYAETPIDANKGTLSIIRKRLTRELAQGIGNKFMKAGEGEERHSKILVKKPKRSKRTRKTRRRK